MSHAYMTTMQMKSKMEPCAAIQKYKGQPPTITDRSRAKKMGPKLVNSQASKSTVVKMRFF
jgi:hypothetical protein